MGIIQYFTPSMTLYRWLLSLDVKLYHQNKTMDIENCIILLVDRPIRTTEIEIQL